MVTLVDNVSSNRSISHRYPADNMSASAGKKRLCMLRIINNLSLSISLLKMIYLDCGHNVSDLIALMANEVLMYT